MKGFIDSIQNHLLPWDKFYNYSITINQSSFGPTLFSKIAQICDSVNKWGKSKIEWSLLTDRLTKFKTWSNVNLIDYSQWECGEEWSANLNEMKLNLISVFPNPTNDHIIIKSSGSNLEHFIISDVSGKCISEFEMQGEKIIETKYWMTGVYFLRNDNGYANKIQVFH